MKKAIGFPLKGWMGTDVYGQVWSEDGEFLGQWISSNVVHLAEDLALCAPDYDYQFVKHIPEFLVEKVKQRLH